MPESCLIECSCVIERRQNKTEPEKESERKKKREEEEREKLARNKAYQIVLIAGCSYWKLSSAIYH